MDGRNVITSLHHVGRLTDDLDEGIKFYESMGFKVASEFTFDSAGAKAAMMKKDKAIVELWQFKDETNELAEMVKNHFALATDNIEEDIQKFVDAGYTVAIPIDKGKVVKRYAYVKDKAGNYIELCEPLD
ncbi:MAG TPA: VOC family protein [Candidatus Saccharimonadales bacterium]|nr:VOC family protein [Candidatus Saccharimonadales bacterium]